MATVTQNITPIRTFQPFEGLSEAQRLVTSVPRGILRFQSTEAIDAKPVNDDLVVNITCSLPPTFAYVISALNWEVEVDTAEDWTAFVRARVFNGLPNADPGNNQVAAFNFSNWRFAPLIQRRVLDFSLGSIREWYPQPLVRSPGAAGMSFIVNAGNGNNNVQAAGTQDFNVAFYQYELNQAVRHPLNSPVPVGIR